MKPVIKCEKEGCLKIADIRVNGHKFCMEHYEEYYNRHSLAILDFDWIIY